MAKKPGSKRRSKMKPALVGMKVKSKKGKMTQYNPCYAYDFSLLPNVLVGGLTPTSSIIEFVAGSSQVGALPFENTKLGTPVGSGTLFPNTWDFGFATTFKISDIANIGLYTALYDSYRLLKVDVEVSYLNNFQDGGKGTLPTLYLYNDPDDAFIPVNLNDIQGKQGLRSLELGNKAITTYNHSVKLFTAPILNGPGTAVGFGTKRPGQWLDCLSPNIEHYALKGYITDLYIPRSPQVTQAFKWKFKYHVEFRGPIKAY